MSQFEKWFKKQFGGLPSLDRRLKLRQKKSDLRRQLMMAEREFRRELELQDKFDAALKGRLAAERNFQY